MTSQLGDAQLATLRLACDTVVPRIERDDDPDGFWARSASDVGADAALAEMISELPDEQRAGMAELLDALEGQGFSRVSQRSREQLFRNVALVGPEAAAGIGTLIGAALYLAYGLPDDAGRNPNWATLAYPGPISAPPDVPKPIAPLVPEGELELEADVAIVGSGAGGGVIAATLASRGLKVVVLEAAGYFNEADFNMLELWAHQNLYWRGGPQPTGEGNVSLQAGSSVGGGTTINWTNCLRTHPWVRDQWAREFGLEGLDGTEFDRHLDAVLGRLGATDRCSDYNGPTQRLHEGCERLGWSFETVVRNADPACYSPETAAYMGFGDQSGSKLSTTKTFLQDAVDAGAEIVARTTADRIVTEGGRAAGVEATYTDPETGRTARITVRAPSVVVACGALESPALLLRSGIGGPAVGLNLRLHPCTAIIGTYGEDQRAWWGAPHTGICDEFADVGDGHGFLIETAQYTTGIGASAVPFTTAAEHKRFMERFRFGSTFIALLRDRGGGQVTLDGDGNGVPYYSLTDEVDVRNALRGVEVQVRLHEAAGAREIYALAEGLPVWRSGEDLGAFIARVQRVPLRAGGYRLFSAHQMGTCRMGTDTAQSVAGPWGELHDVSGVWIGDGSAFPTASGTNPMITIMALAHRTAEAVAEAAGRPAGAAEPAVIN
jgi:choline dehydrogenase-like flavoprotein